MKNVYLPLLLLAALPGFSQKIVENQELPTRSPKTIQFTEEQRFGIEEEGDQYLWSGINTSVTADQDGNFYVSDFGGKRVIKFDARGRFVKVIGPNGNGPGEYQGNPTFLIHRNGGAIGLDLVPNSMPRIHHYDKALNYTNSTALQGGEPLPWILFSSSPDGSTFGTFALKIDPEAGKIQTMTGVMDRNFKFLKVLTKNERATPDRNRLTDPAFWEDYLAGNLSQFAQGIGHVCFDTRGNIYTGTSGKYQITKWSPDLKDQLLVINKKFKPLPMVKEDIDSMVESVTSQIMSDPFLSQIVTESVVRRATEKADLPPAKNPINGLLITDEGYLLVVRDLSQANGGQMADLFSPDGDFLGSVTLAGGAFFDFSNNRPRMSFYGDKAISTAVNPDGEIQVVRYSWKIVDAR